MPSQSKRTPLRRWLREFFMRGCAVTFGHFKFTARRGVHGKVRRGAGGGTTFGVGSFERAEKSSGRIGAGLPAAGWRIPRTPASLRGSG